MGQVDKSLGKLAEKGKLTADERSAALGRIRATTSIEDVAAADLVIEAVVENLQVKTQVFGELDRLTRPEAILASNTSSISITKLGAATRRPEKVIGMHFMNPVPADGAGRGDPRAGHLGRDHAHGDGPVARRWARRRWR